MLAIWFKLLKKFGITEVLINAHANIAHVRQFLLGRFQDFQVTLAEEPELLGSAGTLAANRAWVGSDSSFWVLYADVLTNANLDRMRRFHESHLSAATLGVYRVSDPRRCGIAVVDPSGLVERFVEKPTDPPGNLAFSGVLIGTQELFEVIPPQRPADIGFDVIPRLTGRMFAYPIPEFLQDIGTMENYRQAQVDWPGVQGRHEDRFSL